jgi:hypothetical protein
VDGLGKLAHCHPAKLTVFLQALPDVCVDGALAIHEDHPSNAKNGLYSKAISLCGSNSVIAVMSAARPLFHRRRKSIRALGMSRMCQWHNWPLSNPNVIFSRPLAALVARV